MSKTQKRWLVWETVLSFALPTYFLFWGVLFSPVLLAGAARGVGYVIVHLLCTLGGILGMVALVFVLRYIVRKRDSLPWVFVAPAMVLGLASIWTTMTGQFTGIDLNWFSVLAVGAPTVCSVHVLWLAIQRSRNEPPNKRRWASRT
jgi:hypothetical protein